jgi:DNA-directed RNA polymerase subunit H (RpoH/RPB5)
MRLPVTFFYSSREKETKIGYIVHLDRELFASDQEYDEILPYVKEAYLKFIKSAKVDGLKKTLDKFLRQISTIAIPDSAFIECASIDLNFNISQIRKAILSTDYIIERLNIIKNNLRKLKKNDPVEYAESLGELVSLLGFEETIKILGRNNIKIGKSTLRSLHKVSMLPIDIKRLIKEGKIPLTIAFELPTDERIWEFAERISNLKYHEARKILKQLKQNKGYSNNV